MPRRRRSPAGSARWPVPPGRPATRQAGWPRGSPPPSAPGRTTRPGWPSWRSACPLPRRTRTLRRRPSPLPVLTAGEARAERDRLAELAVAARNAEMDARLEVRTVEERLRAITGRADSLAAAAIAERQARQRAEARRIRRASEAALASAVAAGASYAVARIGQSLSVADADRRAAELASSGRDDQLKAVRAQIRELSGELDKVVDSAHGAEIARATRRMQLEQIAARAAEEFAIDAEALDAEYGPGGPRPAGRREPAAAAVRPGRPGEACPGGAAPAGPARQGQPAGAGGVRRAGGTARLPRHPAGGPQARPAVTC